MWKRIGGGVGLLVLAGAGVASAVFRPDQALKVAAGVAAHHLCAAAFTQHVDPDQTFRELVRPMISIAGPVTTYSIDRPNKAATARVLGLVTARAEWTEGYGCRLVLDPHYTSPMPVAERPLSPPDGFAPATVVAPRDPALIAALDTVFSEPAKGPHRFAKAVVIVKDGKVVAERYAPGYGVDTPMLSYSVAKSFTNAVLAILVRDGKLRVEAPVGAPEWAGPGDPRGRITLNDLLRMQTGLNADETGSGFDPASIMVYARDDMAGYAARHPLKHPVGTVYAYTSANTLILDRALGRAIGGGAAGFRRFAETELFAPLHMDHVTLEFDGTGVFSGSAHVYAPARAFARFGQLYLNDGVAPDGRRLLPEGWVAYSRRSTLGAPYGAGFWTLDGPSEIAVSLVAQGFPKDGFFASGNRGQRIYIVPSQHLVMARFGYSAGKLLGIREDMAALKAAIAAYGVKP